MERVIIIGAGGHGREVADALLACVGQGEPMEPLGFIDENWDLHGQHLLGLPVLGGWEWFEGVDRGEVRVICAVGAPANGRRLAERAESIRLRFTNVVSPGAYVSPGAVLGSGIAIFPHAVVQPQVRIEDHCILNVASTVSHDSTIGRFTNVNPGAHLAGNVFVSEGCYIGMGANILQGRSIGAWTTIGAGAVVNRDLPAEVTAVGVPATVIKQRGMG